MYLDVHKHYTNDVSVQLPKMLHFVMSQHHFRLNECTSSVRMEHM